MKTMFLRSAPYRWVGIPAVLLTLAVGILLPAAASANSLNDEDTLTIVSVDALTEGDMTQERGGTAYVISDQTLTSTSTGNVMNVTGNMTNGSIYTGENFGGSGFGSFVMNTGNNSTINSGVSLSVLMLQ